MNRTLSILISICCVAHFSTSAQMYYRPLGGVNTDTAVNLSVHVGYHFEKTILKDAVVEVNAHMNILDSKHYDYFGLNLGYQININDVWAITPVAGASLAAFTSDKNEFTKKNKCVFNAQLLATNDLWAYELGLHGKVISIGVGFNIGRHKND